MKKSQLKPIIKAIIKEAAIANTFKKQILEMYPGDEPGKWQKISGVSGSKKSTPEAKQFAKEVKDKMAERMRKQGQMGYNDLDALMGIIEYKLTKEGWIKVKPQEPLTHKGHTYYPPSSV